MIPVQTVSKLKESAVSVSATSRNVKMRRGKERLVEYNKRNAGRKHAKWAKWVSWRVSSYDNPHLKVTWAAERPEDTTFTCTICRMRWPSERHHLNTATCALSLPLLAPAAFTGAEVDTKEVQAPDQKDPHF